VLQIRAQDVLPVHIGPQVIRALFRMEAELDAGALVTVTRKRRGCGFCLFGQTSKGRRRDRKAIWSFRLRLHSACGVVVDNLAVRARREGDTRSPRLGKSSKDFVERVGVPRSTRGWKTARC
jgi:hypothetical protein